MSCDSIDLGDGNFAIICGRRHQYCACGRVAKLLCDWKVPGRKSGTCDQPICATHALQVATDRHLCPAHQRAFADWKKRHPGVNVDELRRGVSTPEDQTSLFEEEA